MITYLTYVKKLVERYLHQLKHSFYGIKQKKIINEFFFHLTLQLLLTHLNVTMLRERCLRIIYNEKQSPFTELLNKDNSVSIHITNIQQLAIEILRFYNGLSLISNIFKLKAEHSRKLRQVSEISTPMVKSVYHRTESISYLGPKI